jgi:hypothetical protein
MPESGPSGSVRGARGNPRPYRDFLRSPLDPQQGKMRLSGEAMCLHGAWALAASHIAIYVIYDIWSGMSRLLPHVKIDIDSYIKNDISRTTPPGGLSSMTLSRLKPHPIPDAALDADIAILGKKGRGKTFTAKGVVERLLHMQRRVLVLDPLSV